MVSKRRQGLAYLAFFITAIVVLNVISSFFFTRFDFTAEKRFTLSPVSLSVIENIKEDVQITVYLEGDLQAGFRRLRNSASDMLSDLRSYSHGRLHVDFVNPMSGDEAARRLAFEKLLALGLEPTNLSVKTDDGVSQTIIFPAGLVTCGDRQVPVRFLQNRAGATFAENENVLNNAVQNLEYALVSAIRKASGKGRPRIGFTEGHGELTDQQLNDAMASLSDGYEVGRINLQTVNFDGLGKLSVLIVPKPEREFSETEKYKIDYFVTHGGRVFWAIDNVSAELDSLRGEGQQLTFAKKLNLDDLLFKYGVRINYDLIADLNCAQIPVKVGVEGGQGQIRLLPWIFFPIFIPGNTHPMIRNLDGIRSEFSGSIDTIGVKGIRKQVILASSPFSKRLQVPQMLSLQMIEQQPDPAAFRGTPVPAGVLLEGRFPSAFKNRPVPEGISNIPSALAISEPAKMVVVADGDILKNQVSGTDNSPFPLGYDRYTQIQYGNRNFLLNVADYLTDDSGLIRLRNKEIRIRLLDRARIRSGRIGWQLLNIGLPLFLLTVCGIFQHYLRKRKYAV